MNLDEFGQKVRESDTAREHYTSEELATIPNRVLAMRVLDRYPQYWDMISPAARRIKELIEEDTEKNRYLFGATVNRKIADRGRNIANKAAEIRALYDGDQMLEATASGVPITHLGEMKLLQAQIEGQAKLMQLESYLKRLEIELSAKTAIESEKALLDIRTEENERTLQFRLKLKEHGLL